MWQLAPDDIRQSPVELDFSSSGGSTVDATAIEADGLRLINAAGLVDWSERPVQLEVCEQCGIPRCQPGATVAVRRAGRFAVLMPAFEAMSEGEWARSEYRPPQWLRQHGALVLPPDAAARLREICSLPPLESLEPLRAAEAVRILQFEAPHQLLGSFPDPARLVDGDLVGSDPVDLDETRRLLESVIADGRDSDRPVSLRPRRGDDPVVTMFVDAVEFLEWAPLVASEPRPALHFEGGLVAELHRDST